MRSMAAWKWGECRTSGNPDSSSFSAKDVQRRTQREHAPWIGRTPHPVRELDREAEPGRDAEPEDARERRALEAGLDEQHPRALRLAQDQRELGGQDRLAVAVARAGHPEDEEPLLAQVLEAMTDHPQRRGRALRRVAEHHEEAGVGRRCPDRHDRDGRLVRGPVRRAVAPQRQRAHHLGAAVVRLHRT
jgi:hypothetical protein